MTDLKCLALVIEREYTVGKNEIVFAHGEQIDKVANMLYEVEKN